MARPATCARCEQPILERGNEIPWAGGLYHCQCYGNLRAEEPEMPTLEELQTQLDGERSPRL